MPRTLSLVWHRRRELIDIKRPVEQLVTQLPWASKAAEKEYLEFARMIDDRIDQDPALRPFLTRAAETAIRLATIRAAGVGYQSAVVAVDDVYWGAGIAWLTGQQLYAGAQTAVPETERSRWIKRILDRIRAGNFKKKKVKVRYLQQRLGRYLKAKEIKDRRRDDWSRPVATGTGWNFSHRYGTG